MAPGTSTIAIACATDDLYAPHCATMLRSLLAHTPAASVRIHVLHGGALSPDHRAGLEKLVTATGASLQWLEIAPAQLAGFPSGRFHVACWYRVLLPLLLPDVSRILYLDSDALVLDDLSSLWNTDLRGNLFGAVVNPLYPFMPNRIAALGLDRADEYLNSGVMLMDLDRMRDADLVQRLRAYASQHPDNPWPEQDALSVVCRGDWLRLHPRWNAQSSVFDLRPDQLAHTREEVAEALERPAIVHFIGPHKPWHYLCRHPLRHLYAEHRRHTPWPVFELEGKSLINRMLRPLSLGAQLKVRALLRPWVRRWREARLRGPRLMDAFARRYPEASFVQVGSNDAAKRDPLRAAFLKSRWTGVMVEPVPYVFERLRANYGSNARVRLENVAVATQSGSMPFHYLAQAAAGETLPPWYDELGSFRKDVVLKHADRIPNLERRLVSADIPCVTLTQLCRRNGITAVDLLHMDLEGYDYELIKSIDFTTLRPLVLVYEHKHLDPLDRRRCLDGLREAGYAAFEERADTWCIDTRVRDERHERFLQTWRRIAGRSAA